MKPDQEALRQKIGQALKDYRFKDKYTFDNAVADILAALPSAEAPLNIRCVTKGYTLRVNFITGENQIDIGVEPMPSAEEGKEELRLQKIVEELNDSSPECLEAVTELKCLRLEDENALLRKDSERLNKLDALLKDDPFRLSIKWDNHNDSGVYIMHGEKRVARSDVQSADDDPEDEKGKTIRAAIDNLP